MSSGLNGPSANVPSISNETVLTPSLQQLKDDMVEMWRVKFSSIYPNPEEHQLITAAEVRITYLVDSGGIDFAAEWVEGYRLRMVFGE
jgi:hypothetical protein